MNNYLTPRLKPLVEFYSAEDKIYFFSRPGVAIEMQDASEFIFTVCKTMNGEKTLEEIKKILLPLFPHETPYLENLLTVLDTEYLLEDTSRNAPSNLTSYDVTRWSRNIEFFGAHCRATENKFSYQEKLKSTKVAIFGLGGVGSNILYNLAAMGLCNFKIIDFDNVELSNLNRQIIYNESDIGQFKSMVANNRIKQFLPAANIEIINKKISCVEDIEDSIQGMDIIITAIDQPREKIMDWFNIACVKHNIPFLCGSLDSKAIIYYTIVPGKTGCIECWKDDASKSSLIHQNIIQQKRFVSSESQNIAIMPFISILSGMISNELLKFITGIAEPQSIGRLCSFDFITSQTTIAENWLKNPACLICGTV